MLAGTNAQLNVIPLTEGFAGGAEGPAEQAAQSETTVSAYSLDHHEGLGAVGVQH
jgi:hypothetical protein